LNTLYSLLAIALVLLH